MNKDDVTLEDDAIKDYLDATQALKDLLPRNVDEDEFVVDNNDNINLNVDYPYIAFNRDDLIRAMNLCNKVVQQKSDITTYNSISIVTSIAFNSVYFYATNELSHFRYRADLLGDKDKMLDMNISIPIIILQKLVRLMGNKVLIYKKDLNLYIRLLDGDLLLDLRLSDMNILKFPGEVKDKICDLNVDTIGNVINMMLPLLNIEVRGEARRIFLTGEEAYYYSSFYYIESKIKTPVIALSFKDAEFISKLYKYYKDSQLQLFSVSSEVPRMYLKLGDIEYLFMNNYKSVSSLIISQMEKVVKHSEVTLNFDKLYRVVNLATSLPSSTGNIELNYKDNKLVISIVSVKGNSNFNIPIIEASDDLYNKPALVKADTLKTLLSSFNEANTVGLAISDLGITIESNNVKAIMMLNN